MATVDMDEYFYGQGITVIEWPERLGDLKPREYIQIDIAHQDETKRSFSFFAAGDNYRKRLKMILDKIL